MITWKHMLNDVEIDEPVGFASIGIGPIRDDQYHGIGFEATASTLTFTGKAYDIIYNAKESTGLKSNIIYSASSMCEGEQEFTEVFSGRVNFGAIKNTCGDSCSISAPVESQSCEVVLNARFDQNVDVDAGTGIDTTTALQHYAEMGNEITLPPGKLLVIDEAQNEDQNTEVISDQVSWVVTDTGNNMFGYITPRLNKTLNSSLGTFLPSSFTQLYTPGSPLPEDEAAGYTVDTTKVIGNLKCDFEDGVFTFRIKGSHQFSADIASIGLTLKVIKMPAGLIPDHTQPFFNWITLYTQTLSVLSTVSPANTTSATFDLSGTVTAPIVQGDRFDFILTVGAGRFSEIHSYSLTLDPESFFKVEAASICEASDTQYYMIHETLSHISEEITNGCLRVKSSYYGRRDSQPYEFPEDGCGGLRMLTSGLKIRKAANPTFFTSLKFIIDGLRAIDNIGFDVFENDMRVEDVSFFYRDKEICRCPAVAKVDWAVDESGHYAKITAGYKTWKVERINGLDEFNSEREFKTSLDTISTELNIQSALVAGSYPIEVTRQQSFADTGAADTSYDNEVFIMCLRRYDYPYSFFEVERGIIDSPANMYSPETVYNWRIRPIANLMRWYKVIASSYRDFTNTLNKIFFSSGTGNILAQGQTNDPVCRPEKTITTENQNLFFTQVNDYTPIWINETANYSYPMSLAQYKKIKADPYGYVSFQCGTGQWYKGFIKQIQYQMVDGLATFTLKRKYE